MGARFSQRFLPGTSSFRSVFSKIVNEWVARWTNRCLGRVNGSSSRRMLIWLKYPLCQAWGKQNSTYLFFKVLWKTKSLHLWHVRKVQTYSKKYIPNKRTPQSVRKSGFISHAEYCEYSHGARLSVIWGIIDSLWGLFVFPQIYYSPFDFQSQYLRRGSIDFFCFSHTRLLFLCIKKLKKIKKTCQSKSFKFHNTVRLVSQRFWRSLIWTRVLFKIGTKLMEHMILPMYRLRVVLFKIGTKRFCSFLYLILCLSVVLFKIVN